MPIITVIEIIYLIITVLVIGYIFSGMSRLYSTDPLKVYKRFDWDDFKFAIMIAAPGIILHELAHKFVAMGFGLEAVYQIWPLGLAIGAALKAFGSSFILLAPGYVLIQNASVFQMSLSAFAGPAVNLALWIIPVFMLKKAKNMSHKKVVGLVMLKQINKWLFLFNMIPLPPLDGSKVFLPILSALF